MTAADGSRDNEALVAFLQALALLIVSIDELPQGQRTTAQFVRNFDGLLDEILNMAEREGAAEIHASAQVLRKNLDTALRQARLARFGTGGNGNS